MMFPKTGESNGTKCNGANLPVRAGGCQGVGSPKLKPQSELNSGMLSLLTGLFKNWKLDLVLILLIAGILTAAVCYFTYSQNQIRMLSGQVAQVTAELKDAKAAYEAQRDDAVRSKAMLDALNTRLSKIRVNSQKQVVVIQKHDLGRIAEKHPTLLENRINKATAATLKRLEDISRGR
jgi:outer membrane murein-binding lipoprotein Lpp